MYLHVFLNAFRYLKGMRTNNEVIVNQFKRNGSLKTYLNELESQKKRGD